MATNQKQLDWHRTALRLPPDLHRQVREAAHACDRSFNGQIVAFLRESVAQRQEREAAHAQPA